MKKIIVDLDILTNALWKGDKKKQAEKFLEEVKTEEYEIYTPASLIETLIEWENREVIRKIITFCSENSEILSLKRILIEFKKLPVDYKSIVKELVEIGIKEEDAFLVMVASVFGLEIKTFNKTHLVKRKDEINSVLRKFGLKEVEISEPI